MADDKKPSTRRSGTRRGAGGLRGLDLVAPTPPSNHSTSVAGNEDTNPPAPAAETPKPAPEDPDTTGTGTEEQTGGTATPEVVEPDHTATTGPPQPQHDEDDAAGEKATGEPKEVTPARREQALAPADEGTSAAQATQDLLSAPEVSTRITTSNIRKATLGLRVPAEINDWWKRWGKLQQAIYDIPDGVLPEIAAQIIVEQQDEIVRRVMEWKRENSR